MNSIMFIQIIRRGNRMRETLVMLKNEFFTFLLNYLKNAIMYLEQLLKKKLEEKTFL